MKLSELATHLDRHLRPGVPKYVSLKDAFIQAVALGHFLPGDRVPNEQELASALPMSLGTIQRALRELVHSGVIERRQGHGSFIAGHSGREAMSQPFHCRFLDDSGQAYLPVFPEVIGRSTKPAPGPWQQALRPSKAVEIIRRIRIGDEFYVHSSFIADAELLPVFATVPLQQLASSNFKDIIFRARGQSIAHIDIFTRQQTPSRAVAELIDVSPRQLCTSIRAIAYLADVGPVYYQNIHIPPTTRELHIVADARAPGLLDDGGKSVPSGAKDRERRSTGHR